MGKSDQGGSCELLCLPWAFSAPLRCDGASDTDAVDPFPRVLSALCQALPAPAPAPAEPEQQRGVSEPVVSWFGPRCSHSGSLGSRTEAQACGSRVHRACLWDQSKSEVSLREAVAEVSPQLQKPGLRSSCERCCPAVTDALVLHTQVAKHSIWGCGKSEGLLGPHPGLGTSPEKLGCDGKSGVKPSPAFL